MTKNTIVTGVLSIAAVSALAAILFAGSKIMSVRSPEEAVAETSAVQTGTESAVTAEISAETLPVETAAPYTETLPASTEMTAFVSGTQPAPAEVTTVVYGTQPVLTVSPAQTTAAAQPVRTDIISVDGLTYVQGLLIVNKTYPLPAGYNPNGLDPVCEKAFSAMQEAAAKDGLKLEICSGFRTYERQQKLYNDYCFRDGQKAADLYSARPGHSEHQSGLAIDINTTSNEAFLRTPESAWLANHSWEYGFIIRYPKDKESYTGYSYEASHIRYVGSDYAKMIHETGLCLEELLNIKSEYIN